MNSPARFVMVKGKQKIGVGKAQQVDLQEHTHMPSLLVPKLTLWPRGSLPPHC